MIMAENKKIHIEDKNIDGKFEETTSCGEFLKRIRLDKGYSIEKTAEETKILASIIKDIENNAYENLPPPVYLRGIIKKYANFLKLDEEKTLALYQKSNGRNLSSGKNDLPPKNRFFINESKFSLFFKNVLPQFLRWIFWFLILSYFIYEASFFILPAKIILYSPLEDFTTIQPELKISGKVIRAKGFFVKDKEIFLEKNGEFNDKIMLLPGLNNIEFKAINILNHISSIERQIIYTPIDLSDE